MPDKYRGVSMTLVSYFGFIRTISLFTTRSVRLRTSPKNGSISVCFTDLFAVIALETSSALAATPYFLASLSVMRLNLGNSLSKNFSPFASTSACDSEDGRILSGSLCKVIQEFLQLLVGRLLLDRLDYLKNTIATN